MDKEQIYKEILWRKGEHRQMEKAIEKTLKLGADLAKYNSRDIKLDGMREEVIDSLASAQIMYEQVVGMLACQEELQVAQEKKMQRLLVTLSQN